MPFVILAPTDLSGVVPPLSVSMTAAEVVAVITLMPAHGDPTEPPSGSFRVVDQLPTRRVDQGALTDQHRIHALLAEIEGSTPCSDQRCRILFSLLARDSQGALDDLRQFFIDDELENPHLGTACEHVWGMLKLCFLNVWQDASAARQKVVPKTLERLLTTNSSELQGKKCDTAHAAVRQLVSLADCGFAVPWHAARKTANLVSCFEVVS